MPRAILAAYGLSGGKVLIHCASGALMLAPPNAAASVLMSVMPTWTVARK